MLLAKINMKEEIEPIEVAKELVIILKEELECKQDLIMQEEYETFKTFSDLYFKKEKAIYQLDLKGKKLVKLGVSKQKLMQLKNQIIQVDHLDNGTVCLIIIKNIFIVSMKSLIVYVNRVLLGFFSCQALSTELAICCFNLTNKQH